MNRIFLDDLKDMVLAPCKKGDYNKIALLGFNIRMWCITIVEKRCLFNNEEDGKRLSRFMDF